MRKQTSARKFYDVYRDRIFSLKASSFIYVKQTHQ